MAFFDSWRTVRVDEIFREAQKINYRMMVCRPLKNAVHWRSLCPKIVNWLRNKHGKIPVVKGLLPSSFYIFTLPKKKIVTFVISFFSLFLFSLAPQVELRMHETSDFFASPVFFFSHLINESFYFYFYFYLFLACEARRPPKRTFVFGRGYF